MTGPNAYIFSKDIIEPIKIVSEAAKKNENLTIKAGYINGEFADTKLLVNMQVFQVMKDFLQCLLVA